MIEDLFSSIISKHKRYIALYLISAVLASVLATSVAGMSFYFTIIHEFAFVGFLSLNFILLFGFYVYFSSISVDRRELLFVRCLKSWSIFIPVFIFWLILRLIAPGFCALCGLFWPMTYVVIFAAINHTLIHSKKLYKDKNLFADKSFFEIFKRTAFHPLFPFI